MHLLSARGTDGALLKSELALGCIFMCLSCMQSSEASATARRADGDLQLPLELLPAPKPSPGTVSLKLEVVNAIHKVLRATEVECEADPLAAAALQVIARRTVLSSRCNDPAWPLRQRLSQAV